MFYSKEELGLILCINIKVAHRSLFYPISYNPLFSLFYFAAQIVPDLAIGISSYSLDFGHIFIIFKHVLTFWFDRGQTDVSGGSMRFRG